MWTGVGCRWDERAGEGAGERIDGGLPHRAHVASGCTSHLQHCHRRVDNAAHQTGTELQGWVSVRLAGDDLLVVSRAAGWG